MRIKIVRYLAAFNTRSNKAALLLKLENGQELKLRDLPADIFNAYMSVLKNEPVFFDTENGWVQTGLEEPVDFG
jgi:hypothetical protein